MAVDGNNPQQEHQHQHQHQHQLDLLNTLTEALTNASEALQAGTTTTTGVDHDTNNIFAPPADGLSLLDVKNSLLLSYLQSLVFLVLVQVRQVQSKETEGISKIGTAMQRKLSELRVYLDRGVRPIEGRLKYQIDSALRAADSAKREAHAREAARINAANDEYDDASDSGEDHEQATTAVQLDQDHDSAGDALLYKPNLSLPKRDKAEASGSRDRSLANSSSNNSNNNNVGAYKAPRINPTAMPDPDKRVRTNEPRKRKSQLLNEYIDEELSSTPRAQPSIGSNNTILDRGRGGLSQREREKERERTEYEERNFTRLPAQTKKERRELRRKGLLDNRDIFGGEDWTGLGGLGDRVSRSVSVGRREKEGVLQRREKRRPTEDLPRGDGTGMGIGHSFEKRRRILEARAERKASKKR